MLLRLRDLRRVAVWPNTGSFLRNPLAHRRRLAFLEGEVLPWFEPCKSTGGSAATRSISTES